MAARLRRRAPIRLGGSTFGSAVSSPGYMGSVIDTLNGTLHQMQVFESLKHLSNGDPETFLALAKPLLDKIGSGDPMYAFLKDYVSRATEKVADDKKESALFNAKNWTGLRQFYGDQLAKTTDQASRDKLMSNIDKLDKLVRASAATGQGSDLLTKRGDYLTKVRVAQEELSAHGAISSETWNAAKSAAYQYSVALQTAENDPGTSNTARLGYQNSRTGKGGPDSIMSELTVLNDKKVLADNKLTAAEAQEVLAGTAKGTSAQQLNQYADILKRLTTAASAVRDTSLMGHLLDQVKAARADGNGVLTKMGGTPYEQAPTSAPTGEYAKVANDLYQAVRAGLTPPMPTNPKQQPEPVKYPTKDEVWAAFVSSNGDAAQFSTQVGTRIAPDIYKNASDALTAATPNLRSPDSWDWKTGDFGGSPVQRDTAKAFANWMRARSQTPSDPFYGIKGNDREMWSVGTGQTTGDSKQDADINRNTWQGYGQIEANPQWGVGGSLDESTRAARQGGGATGTASMGQSATGPTLPDAQDAQAMAEGGAPLSNLGSTTDNSTEADRAWAYLMGRDPQQTVPDVTPNDQGESISFNDAFAQMSAPSSFTAAE